MRNTVRETVKLGLVLMIIAAISGISLAYVNGITEPIIEERKREETALAMKVVLPHAVVFEDLSDDEITAVKNLDSDFKTLMSASIGYGEDGGVVGAVIFFQRQRIWRFNRDAGRTGLNHHNIWNEGNVPQRDCGPGGQDKRRFHS